MRPGSLALVATLVAVSDGRATHALARSARIDPVATWTSDAQAPSAPAPDARVAPAATPAARDATLERWRESLDLDLPHEVVESGVAAVSGDGPLARDGEAIALVVRALAAAGDTQRARALLDAPHVEPSKRGWIDVARARLALEVDDLANAVALLVSSTAASAPGQTRPDITTRVRNPEIAHAWLVLGRALVRASSRPNAPSNAPSDGERVLARFVEMAPLDAEAPAAWHMLAQSALARGDTQRAAELRARAEQSAQWQAFYRTRRLQIREQPREPLPRLGLAQLWLAADEPARARGVLEELLALAPDFCRALDLLGEAQRKLGDPVLARASYDRALECDASLVEARFHRGLLAAAQGRDADARADLELVVDGAEGGAPRYLRGHLELARALLRAGDLAAAERRYARYRELSGSEPLE